MFASRLALLSWLAVVALLPHSWSQAAPDGKANTALRVCKQGCPFKTVQAALDKAEDGATIKIGEGIFRGDLEVVEDVVLVGSGEAATFLKGTGTRTVVLVKPARTVTISRLTITGGAGDDDSADGGGGGGIEVGKRATLHLDRTMVTGNTADDDGGGILSLQRSRLELVRSTVSDNTALSQGDGLYLMLNSTLVATDSHFTGNQAEIGGGIEVGSWIVNRSSGVTLNGRSRISGNTASGVGGGVHLGGYLTLNDESLIEGNTAGKGGGIGSLAAFFDDDVFPLIEVNGDSSVSGNTPDDCYDQSNPLCDPVTGSAAD